MEHRGLESAILRAALDPMRWHDVVDAFATLAPGTTAHFVGPERTYRGALPPMPFGYASGPATPAIEHDHILHPIRANWTHLTTGTVCAHRQTDAAPRTRAPGAAPASRHIPPPRPAASPPFAGAVGASLGPDRARIVLLASHHDGEAGERTVRATVDRYLPLLRHALEVNRLLLQRRIDDLVQRHGHAPATAGVLLLDAAGRVIFANPLAERMLAAGGPVALDAGGSLKTADPALRPLLEPAARPRLFPVARTRDADGPLLMAVVGVDDALSGDAALGPLGAALAPRTAVILSRPAPRGDDAARVARHLALTSAEAEVALALAQGRTPEEIAADRRVSRHTVRNQVKSALAKVGARRQAELVTLVERSRPQRPDA